MPTGTYPGGLAISPDGTRLYVADNLSNSVSIIDTATNTVKSTTTVGHYPYGVVLSKDGTTAYVSNWGGRRPRPGDLTGPAGRGTEVKYNASSSAK